MTSNFIVNYDVNSMYAGPTIAQGLDYLWAVMQAETDFKPLLDAHIEDAQLNRLLSLFYGTQKINDQFKLLSVITERFAAEDLNDADIFTLQMLGLRKE